MNIISVISGGGPPPLEEQVAQLRQEMHDRFDRVEACLDEIYRDTDHDLLAQPLTRVKI